MVEAERIVLSEDGTVRAVLETDKEGMPSLKFLGQDRDKKFSLTIEDRMPSLAMTSFDGENKVGLGVGVFGAGCPQLTLSSPGKLIGMHLNGGEDAEAAFVVYDDDIRS